MSEEFKTYVSPVRPKKTFWHVNMDALTLSEVEAIGIESDTQHWFVPGVGTCTVGYQLFEFHDEAIIAAKYTANQYVSNLESNINRLNQFIDSLGQL
jgi:hypothetical protein